MNTTNPTNPMKLSSLLIMGLLFLTGCAAQKDANVFTVTKIDPIAEGGVKVKLTTSGDIAEADESMLTAYVKIVAVHEATRRQRELAEARGRAESHKMVAHKIVAEQKLVAGAKPQMPRYLAVPTEKSASSKKGKFAESVMIWDTQSDALVGTNVYDVSSKPSDGQVMRLDTYSAEFRESGY